MRRWLSALLFAIAALSATSPCVAVEPDEMLKDPALEARARDISKHLRCLVCQNQSIDDSNAGLARDLRILVRERLQAGDSDDEVISFVVARYGDFVLLRPPVKGSTYLLWFGPALVLLLAGAGVIGFMKRRQVVAAAGTKALSASERKKLDAILKQDGKGE